MTTYNKGKGAQSCAFEQAVEKLTGTSAREIRMRTVWEQRQAIEEKSGHILHIVSRFPFVGRGNILRGRLVSGNQVNRQIDDALHKL
ncbi:MAG: hypothetical protein PHD76_05695 [Methylacidiphilales bacterium]|nr:hypothetical protein [Candidatus Methylacidiphilales bacterium]